MGIIFALLGFFDAVSLHIGFSREILMFLATIRSSLCFWSSMYRFISPLIVLVPQDSNLAL